MAAKKKDAVVDSNEESVFKDDLVAKSLELIRDTKRPSTSSFQRRLKIGYEKASRLMDHLEAHGVIGPPKGADPRDILMDLDGALPEIPELPDFEPKKVEKPQPLKVLEDLPASEDMQVGDEFASVKHPKTVFRKVERMIDCELTQEEMLAAGKELADAQAELAEVEAELSDIKKDFKERISSIKQRAKEFGAKVRNGTESRLLQCEERLDYPSETYVLVRLDTGDWVEERKMSATELSDLPMGD